jgi:ATP-dependent DNA ligase
MLTNHTSGKQQSPYGNRHRIGSLPLGYYTPDGKRASGASDGSAGKLIYAGRVGTGMSVVELERVWNRLRPLTVDKMPLSEPPPRRSRFGSLLVAGPLGAARDGRRGQLRRD